MEGKYLFFFIVRDCSIGGGARGSVCLLYTPCKQMTYETDRPTVKA